MVDSLNNSHSLKANSYRCTGPDCTGEGTQSREIQSSYRHDEWVWMQDKLIFNMYPLICMMSKRF